MFEMILHATNLAAVTSSLNRFHSFRSQTLFIFLSINTKLNVATFSSSLAQFVVFALKILWFFNYVIQDEQFHKMFQSLKYQLTQNLSCFQFVFAKILWALSRIPFSSVLGILSFVELNLLHNLVGHFLLMFLVYSYQYLHEHTNNNQLMIENTELVDIYHQLCILAHTMLEHHSKKKNNIWNVRSEFQVM